jgi:hypothetical protein
MSDIKTVPATPRTFMSTEYRAKCVEWVLKGHNGQTVHAPQIIKEAKEVYAYVYGESDAPHADN